MTGRVGAGSGPRMTVFAFWPTAQAKNGAYTGYRCTHRSFKHGKSAQSWAGEHLSYLRQVYGTDWRVDFTVAGVKTPFAEIGRVVDAAQEQGAHHGTR